MFEHSISRAKGGGRVADRAVSEAAGVDRGSLDPVTVGVITEVTIAAFGYLLVALAETPALAQILVLLFAESAFEVKKMEAVPTEQPRVIVGETARHTATLLRMEWSGLSRNWSKYRNMLRICKLPQVRG